MAHIPTCSHPHLGLASSGATQRNSQHDSELGLVELKEPEREIGSRNNEVGGFGVAFGAGGASDLVKLLRLASTERDW
ncbi:hypothetical protein FCV25MIE_14465, partial [Fagus crenata]